MHRRAFGHSAPRRVTLAKHQYCHDGELITISPALKVLYEVRSRKRAAALTITTILTLHPTSCTGTSSAPSSYAILAIPAYFAYFLLYERTSDFELRQKQENWPNEDRIEGVLVKVLEEIKGLRQDAQTIRKTLCDGAMQQVVPTKDSESAVAELKPPDQSGEASRQAANVPEDEISALELERISFRENLAREKKTVDALHRELELLKIQMTTMVPVVELEKVRAENKRLAAAVDASEQARAREQRDLEQTRDALAREREFIDRTFKAPDNGYTEVQLIEMVRATEREHYQLEMSCLERVAGVNRELAAVREELAQEKAKSLGLRNEITPAPADRLSSNQPNVTSSAPTAASALASVQPRVMWEKEVRARRRRPSEQQRHGQSKHLLNRRLLLSLDPERRRKTAPRLVKLRRSTCQSKILFSMLGRRAGIMHLSLRSMLPQARIRESWQRTRLHLDGMLKPRKRSRRTRRLLGPPSVIDLSCLRNGSFCGPSLSSWSSEVGAM